VLAIRSRSQQISPRPSQQELAVSVQHQELCRQLGEGSNKSAVQGYDRAERITVGKRSKQLHQWVLGIEAATHRLKIHDVVLEGIDLALRRRGYPVD
jgi:hypothetical protein